MKVTTNAESNNGPNALRIGRRRKRFSDSSDEVHI